MSKLPRTDEARHVHHGHQRVVAVEDRHGALERSDDGGARQRGVCDVRRHRTEVAGLEAGQVRGSGALVHGT